MTNDTRTRYFHGGAAGLQVGDRLVPKPPLIAHPNCPECKARAAGVQIRLPDGRLSEPPTGQPDKVYISTDKLYARYYASMRWLGDLYRVEPEGEVVRSTEDAFDTFICSAAVVVQVIDRAVRLTPKERRQLDRRWAALEVAARREGMGIPRQLNRR
ncbi:hypothetical protein [Streptomyces sp. NRRL S-350]|uniref:hypothetical protein n=1 Tax=Streptomyces sp. NRRL S-350 TaxID=1463902 RepID=UPI0007C4A527|nr:hypothetical protein [Streptomyces sp. NRRL S-350]